MKMNGETNRPASIIYQKATSLKKFDLNDSNNNNKNEDFNGTKSVDGFGVCVSQSVNSFSEKNIQDDDKDDADMVLLDKETYNSLIDEIQSMKLLITKLVSLLSTDGDSEADDLVRSLSLLTSNVMNF